MEVRHGALITFFKTLKIYGGLLVGRTWSVCMWRLVLPLLWEIEECAENASDEVIISFIIKYE